MFGTTWSRAQCYAGMLFLKDGTTWLKRSHARHDVDMRTSCVRPTPRVAKPPGVPVRCAMLLVLEEEPVAHKVCILSQRPRPGSHNSREAERGTLASPNPTV
jgi:hypothetical protein